MEALRVFDRQMVDLAMRYVGQAEYEANPFILSPEH